MPQTFDARVHGLSYDAILYGLTKRAQDAWRGLGASSAGLDREHTTRTLRNRARFIAERALEMPSQDRYDFVNHKVWEG